MITFIYIYIVECSTYRYCDIPLKPSTAHRGYECSFSEMSMPQCTEHNVKFCAIIRTVDCSSISLMFNISKLTNININFININQILVSRTIYRQKLMSRKQANTNVHVFKHSTCTQSRHTGDKHRPHTTVIR